MAARRRVRCELLNPAARIAVPLVLAFAWPLVLVRATWWALDRFAFHEMSAHLLLGSALLITVSFLALVAHPIDRLCSTATWRLALRVAGSSFVGFAILVSAANVRDARVVAPIALATFAAALAEEAVFRAYLPNWLACSLRRAGTRPALASIAVLMIPQLAFAAAHAENSGFASAGLRAFGGLFVAGLLYRVLTRVGGLWMAAAVHAALNLTIALASIPANSTR